MKPKWIPEWIDAILWRFRHYRRNRIRAARRPTKIISTIQWENLREKLADEQITRGAE